MQAISGKVVELARHYSASLRSLFTIPPRSESMAGVIILFVFMNSMATSIWMFNAWTPFVYLLFNKSNLAVGVVSGVNGLFELSCAVISGHMADKVWGPSRTLIFAVRLGIVNLCVVAFAVWTQQRWAVVLAQVFEGSYMGLSLTCVESVFAQCLRTGERDRLYSVKFSVESSGPIVGLISSIILYLIIGTEWNVRVLQLVMSCGLALHLTSMILFATTFVALPSHLDRQKEAEAAAAAAASGVCGESDASRNGGGLASIPARAYDVEEKRVTDAIGYMQEEEEELSPSRLVQRDNTELMNCARTSILQATSYNCPPPLVSRHEPSVCTARNEETAPLPHRREATDAGAGSGVAGTTSAGGDGDGDGEDDESTAATLTRSGGAGAPAPDLDNVPPGAHIEYVDHEYNEATGCRRSVMDCLPLRVYPVAMVVCDLVIVMGSGMTTQYFSLFMMERYHVSLATICALNLCNSVVIAGMAIVTGAAGKRYGRIRALIPPKLIGASLLLYMALAQQTEYGPKFWMCVAYVFRNAFMNCSAGLSRALIMDLVPEERRGRWNALESVQSAGWSGSAIFGGLMADKHGYGAAFIFTFFFHFLSTCALIPFTVRNDSRLPQPVLVYDDPEPQDWHGGRGSKPEARPRAAGTPTTKTVIVAELTTENVRKIASCVSLHREVEESVAVTSEPHTQEVAAKSHTV